MRLRIFQRLLQATVLVFATQVIGAAEIWFTPYYTNAPIVANSSNILEAIRSGDTKSKTAVEALIGSPVAFFGAADFPGSGTNINVYQFISKDSNRVDGHLHIVLNVELHPWRYVRTPGVSSFVEVLGTLKSVDIDNRIIYIRANPDDYREGWTL